MKGCKEELKLKKCGFDPDPDSVDAMVRSEWQSKSKSVYYLIYRWVVAIFVVAVVGIALHDHLQKYSFGLFFIYLTRWGILMNMAVGVMGAVLVTNWHFHEDFKDKVARNTKMPTVFKVYWALHNTALIISIIVSMVYWTVLYRDDKDIDIANILSHIGNSAIMLLDLLIVAHPMRLYHVIQPICFGLIYELFSVIYYLCGGVNIKGKPYIYGVLNWEHPEKAFITIFAILFFGIFIHFFLFWIYKLRVFIQQRYFTDKYCTSEAFKMSSSDNLDNFEYLTK